jgi:hypothetical protein
MTPQVNLKTFKEKAQSYIHEQNASRQTSVESGQLMNLPMTADLVSDAGVCQIQFPQTWNIYPDDRTIQGFSNLLHQLGIHSALQVKYALEG